MHCVEVQANNKSLLFFKNNVVYCFKNSFSISFLSIKMYFYIFLSFSLKKMKNESILRNLKISKIIYTGWGQGG